MHAFGGAGAEWPCRDSWPQIHCMSCGAMHTRRCLQDMQLVTWICDDLGAYHPGRWAGASEHWRGVGELSRLCTFWDTVTRDHRQPDPIHVTCIRLWETFIETNVRSLPYCLCPYTPLRWPVGHIVLSSVIDCH